MLLLMFSWLTCLRYVNCEISWFLLHLIMADQSCFCHQRLAWFLSRAMDGGWDFQTGLPDLSGPSNTPYQDMLNINFEAPGAAAGSPAFQPGSSQGGSGKARKKIVSRPKQNNFSIEEDKNLVSSWLNVSLDAVKGDVSMSICFSCTFFKGLTMCFSCMGMFQARASARHHFGRPLNGTTMPIKGPSTLSAPFAALRVAGLILRNKQISLRATTTMSLMRGAVATAIWTRSDFYNPLFVMLIMNLLVNMTLGTCLLLFHFGADRSSH